MSKDIETREIMINRNGKPLFAVRIDNGGENKDANYVYIENGDIKFNSSWMSSIIPYSLGNESHILAKEIFTIGLQAAVKTKIYELKQLEAILKDLNLSECLGNVLIDNTKLLLQMNENFNRKTETILEASADQIREISNIAVSKSDVKSAVSEAIVNTVRPIAIKNVRQKKTKEHIEGNGYQPSVDVEEAKCGANPPNTGSSIQNE